MTKFRSAKAIAFSECRACLIFSQDYNRLFKFGLNLLGEGRKSSDLAIKTVSKEVDRSRPIGVCKKRLNFAFTC